MGVLSIYIGFGIAFILLILLLLTGFTKPKWGVLTKSMFIIISIWYGLVLFFAPPKLMGWPSFNSPPDNSIIIGHIIREPIFNKGGFIYLLVMTRDETKTSLLDQLDPRFSFILDEKTSPQLYKIKYDRELHKQLAKNEKEGKQSKIRNKMKNPFGLFWERHGGNQRMEIIEEERPKKNGE